MNVAAIDRTWRIPLLPLLPRISPSLRRQCWFLNLLGILRLLVNIFWCIVARLPLFPCPRAMSKNSDPQIFSISKVRCHASEKSLSASHFITFSTGHCNVSGEGELLFRALVCGVPALRFCAPGVPCRGSATEGCRIDGPL